MPGNVPRRSTHGKLWSSRLAPAEQLRRDAGAAFSLGAWVVWALGISLAVKGSWFAAAWLRAKIALVLLLSAAHGYQSGRLRRLAAGNALTRLIPGWWPLAIMAVALVIVYLATGKPG